MKKLLSLLLVCVLSVSLFACGGGSNTSASGVDWSKYPETLDEWGSTEMNNYFTDAGVYTNQDWVFIQDHETYYTFEPRACYEATGYMDDAEEVTISIWEVDVNSTQVDIDAFTKHVKENKDLGEDMGNIPVDHMAGKFIVWDSFTTDEEVLNAFEKAWQELIEHYNVEADF